MMNYFYYSLRTSRIYLQVERRLEMSQRDIMNNGVGKRMQNTFIGRMEGYNLQGLELYDISVYPNLFHISMFWEKGHHLFK